MKSHAFSNRIRGLILISLLSLMLLMPFGCTEETQVVTEIIDTVFDTLGTSSFLATDFDDAQSCRFCHPQQYDEWAGSMHAYAIVDPVFARVREIGQSAYVNALNGACTQCHSPIGKRSGDIKWGPYELDSMAAVSREGIGCDLCHTITSISRMGNGGVEMNPSNTKHGTIRDPQSNTAHESQYNDLYSTSEYCGACHDFVTDKGLELERTYREWRAEGFAATGQTCSDCHMPTYNGQAAVDGPNRTLHRHTFIGADLALVPFPDQANQLNLVTEMLQSALTMTVNAPDTATAGQTYGFTVEILNDKTGHNVPSGVPFNRQMWLSVEVYDGNTLIYESGMLDTNGDLMDDFSEFSERDSALYNAQSFMLRADSSITGLTWEAEYFVDNSIRPGQAKQISYAFDIPVTAVQPLKAIVKLRFRSFPPYVFRAIDLDNLNIPIIDMAVDSVSITL